MFTRYGRGGRRRAGVVVTVLALLLSTACGTADDESGDSLSEEPVTLRMFWWGGDARHAKTQQAIDAFQRKHSNITVKGEFADWTGYWEKLATTVAAGEAPDVVQMDQLYLASYAQRGALKELDSLSRHLATDEVEAGVLDAGKLDGKLYAVPIGAVVEGVMVNEDLLAAHGVTLPDTTSWTWDDLAAVSREISEKSGGEVHGFYPNGGDSMLLNLWARQHGDVLFSDGKLVVKPETVAGFWQYMKDLVDDGAAPSGAALTESLAASLDQTLYSTNKVALAIFPSTMITAYSAASKSRLRLVDLPVVAGASDYQYSKASMYWTVTSGSEHPAEAALLIDFLVNDPEAGKILGVERGVPANTAVRQSIAADLAETEKAASDFNTATAERAGQAPPVFPNGASDIERMLTRHYQDVLFDKSSPADAAKAFVDELTAAIASA